MKLPDSLTEQQIHSKQTENSFEKKCKNLSLPLREFCWMIVEILMVTNISSLCRVSYPFRRNWKPWSCWLVHVGHVTSFFAGIFLLIYFPVLRLFGKFPFSWIFKKENNFKHFRHFLRDPPCLCFPTSSSLSLRVCVLLFSFGWLIVSARYYNK